jgi:hypothetical protein
MSLTVCVATYGGMFGIPEFDQNLMKSKGLRGQLMPQGGQPRPSVSVSAAHPLKIIEDKGYFHGGDFRLSSFCPPFLNQEKSSNWQ